MTPLNRTGPRLETILAVLLAWALAVPVIAEPPAPTGRLTIYEVNLRQATPEGTLDAFREDHLPRLADMGVGILWLMPIHPIGELERKGGLGSYYAVRDYKAVNPEFGDKEDFREFVDAAHKAGMLVILDWVANHTAWDHPWTESNPEWFTKGEDGGFVPPVEAWSDVIDLNYNDPALRVEMLDALLYWVREFGVDGYRCDVAELVPQEFWEDAIGAIRAERSSVAEHDAAHRRPVFMLAEGAESWLHEAGFDATYGWGLFAPLQSVRDGKARAGAIWDYLERERRELPRGAFRMLMTSNHDENSWNNTALERWGPMLDAATVLTFTLPGMPLIYTGQEVANETRLEFFDKDEVDWGDEPAAHPASRLYAELIALKRRHPALRHGPGAPRPERLDVSVVTPGVPQDAVFAFRREMLGRSVVVAVNCIDQGLTASVEGVSAPIAFDAYGWSLFVDNRPWDGGR
ncbi:MAG: alpha-amylase family glycosyl hydrolase [Planctomycetota bacterium]